MRLLHCMAAAVDCQQSELEEGISNLRMLFVLSCFFVLVCSSYAHSYTIHTYPTL